jgi:predicted transcriptional regulator
MPRDKSRIADAGPTYLDPEGQRAIKEHMRKLWQRVSENRGLQQSYLGKALGLSQSAVSKLLLDDVGHPWTPLHLKRTADFLQQKSPLDLVPDSLRSSMEPLFEGWTRPKEIEAGFLAECLAAVEKHYKSKGMNVPARRLQTLAGKLAARLDGTDPSHDDMQKAIDTLVYEQAVGL